ncbi:MAG: hypothetical protein FWD46_01580 [Cystobacterineae bacterium]|nr:hypothetical protein [Cystobacterineae bacterium]
MPKGLNEDERITLHAVCWVLNRLWQQYFDEAKTVYEQVLALAALPDERHRLYDISLVLDEALRAAKHERAHAKRLLLSLVRKLEKLLVGAKRSEVKQEKQASEAKEPPPKAEVWVFHKGSPATKRPAPQLTPSPVPPMQSIEEPSWAARLFSKLFTKQKKRLFEEHSSEPPIEAKTPERGNG